MTNGKYQPMIVTEEQDGIKRYPSKLYQPWNHQFAEFEVVVLPGTTSCCPTQGTFETPDPDVKEVGVWMNVMSPDTTPIGQCGGCGTHVYPDAAVVEPGGDIPDWLIERAEQGTCDFCEQRVKLVDTEDGDSICEPCAVGK